MRSTFSPKVPLENLTPLECVRAHRALAAVTRDLVHDIAERKALEWLDFRQFYRDTLHGSTPQPLSAEQAAVQECA